ncbi:MAG: hypothetical protein CMJ18_18045 [Phycisphaeraceae bacterium]|nr:hypothetical protein [Phycisphaeraceae bacterium]
MSKSPRTVGLWFISAGAVIIAGSVWGLARDVGWIAQPFYAWIWWGYILLLDGYCVVRRGHSMLTTRGRIVPLIAVWSVSFWFFFEILNLRFQNWYYVGVPRIQSPAHVARSMAFVFICFSTVFIGIFVTAEALAAAGVWRNLCSRRLALPGWVGYATQGLGAVMALAAVCFPYYLAPLIWGSFTFLIDPWNHRRGARSILRDVEHGDWGAIARLLLAGLICGFFWESMNFFAPQKWIYTVRGLEDFKLFEMPLLGFLGFPGLALDCVAAFALASSWFIGNRTWEHPADLSYEVLPTRAPRRAVLVLSMPLHGLFWLLALGLYLVVGSTFGSVEVLLNDLSLTERERAVLNDMGITRPRQLLAATREGNTRAVLQRGASIDDERLSRIVKETQLFTFKGIGAHHGRALQRIGVSTVRDLAEYEPETLHRALARDALSRGRRVPRLDMVRVWVMASQDRGIVLRLADQG